MNDTQAQEARLLDHLKQYIQSHDRDIARGAETAELAAVLVEKYAQGMIKAANLLDLETAYLFAEMDRALERIDPNFKHNRAARWAARPARLILDESGAPDLLRVVSNASDRALAVIGAVVLVETSHTDGIGSSDWNHTVAESGGPEAYSRLLANAVRKGAQAAEAGEHTEWLDTSLP